MLVNCLKKLPRVCPIGFDRMRELENRPFHEVVKRNYDESKEDERAMELCSLLEEFFRNPRWHPIKVIMVIRKPENVIDNANENLKDLKKNYGKEVYKALTAAFI
ncbi:hypothetical protein BC332_13756 [Capsicum chinense]|nr:hypothetical protein BC332_13756 [Capsicum chinense]